jgi:hypothetical protein
MLDNQRIELTKDPAIPWVREGEIVGLALSESSLHAPISTVWLVLNDGTDVDDGTRVVSVHRTQMGALKAKGRELRLYLSITEPLMGTERYDYKTYTARPCVWWYSELPSIRVVSHNVAP